jgi:hypothetical protein
MGPPEVRKNGHAVDARVARRLAEVAETAKTRWVRRHAMPQDHWLEGFNYNVEEWFEGDRYETLAICRTIALARFVFKLAIAEKPSGRFMIRSRPRAVKRYPKDNW